MNNDGQDASVAEETTTGTNIPTPAGGATQQPTDSAAQQPAGSTGTGTASSSAVPKPGNAAGTAASGSTARPAAKPSGIWAPGAGPSPDTLSLDPARLADDATIVKQCTGIVESFRQGRFNKASAIAGLAFQFGLFKRHVASGMEPFLEQLDEHERACALAASSASGPSGSGAAGTKAARGADAVSGNRDQLASQSAAGNKRARTDRTNADLANDADSDDDDDVRPAKRVSSGYDSEAAAFRVGLRPRFLSPLAQRTLDAQTNYLADPKRAKRELLATGSAPAFPLELWDDILANRAVDFDKILSASFSTTIIDTTEHRLGGPDGLILHLPNTRARKRVDDYADWLFCFHKWNEAVCTAFPFRRDELFIYLEFFTDLFNSIHKSQHARVIQADAAIRNAAASDPSLTLLDKDRLNVLSMRHVSPWGADIGAARSEPTRRAPPARPGRLSGQPRAGSSGEICKNYNRGICYREFCRHAHKCNRSGCNESHPATEHDGDSSRETTQNGGGRGGQRK